MKVVENNDVYSKNISVKYSSLFAILAVIFLIFPSQLALNSSLRNAINLGVLLFISLSFIFSITNKSLLPKNATTIFILMGALFLSSIISSLNNEWIRPIFAYGAFVLVLFFNVLLIGKGVNPKKYVKVFVLATVFSALLILLVSLVFVPFTFNRYQGILNNPNSMGWMAGSICSLLIGTLYENRLKWYKKQRIFLYSVLFSYGIILLATNSRAALAAVLATIMIFTSIRFFDAFTLTKVHIKRIKRIFISVLIILFIALFSFIGGLLDPVIEKFLVTHERGDITQNRFIAWYASIVNWTWFGLGADYVSLIGMEGQSTGHSTYISQLSRYGLIPLILFTGTFLYIWYKGIIQTKNNISIIAPTLVAVVTGFLVNGIFETGAATPGVWFSLMLFSAMLIENKYKMIYFDKNNGNS